MRIVAISILALTGLTGLTGCVSLHAKVPEELIRQHAVHEDGMDLAAICSHRGKKYSEGAIACMAGARMTCDPKGRWVRDGDCQEPRRRQQ